MPIHVTISSIKEIQNGESYIDLDSHADTCVLGSNALKVETPYPERTAIVSFADPSVGTVTTPILSGAFLYTHYTGTQYILVVHQAIYLENMKHSLLCPMQVRENDIILNEHPKSMTENPTNDTHALSGVTDTNELVRIPFLIRGVTSTFNVSKPTIYQYETLPRLTLTSGDLEWDPQSNTYEQAEAAMLNPYGELKELGDRPDKFVIKSIATSIPTPISIAALNSLARNDRATSQGEAILNSIDPLLNEDVFAELLNETRNLSATSTSNRQGLSAEKLAATWKIPLRQAQNTLRVTTQRGVRHIANPAISRRFRTNDRMLRYRRIPHTVFTDTLKSTVKSKRQNQYAQMYSTDFGYCRAYPIKKEAEAHHTLSKFFKDIGVPDTMVMDGAKAQIHGNFRRKCTEADCRTKQTEPYTPFSNSAEGAIREVKKSSGRKMMESQCPKRLWDDCIELESFIKSHTAIDIWQLEGQVPQTRMTGQTADISQFFELGWYEWCMYHDSAISFPEDKLILGRWLGPSIDVGPAMTGKILKNNGNTRHVSTYRPLTKEELEDPVKQNQMNQFNIDIHEALGPSVNEGDFDDEFEEFKTPINQPYGDDDTKPFEVTDRDEYQDFDAYIGAEVLLPHEDSMRTARVRERKRDADGTLKGTSHRDVMFDTRAYILEFPDGAEAEYTANIIAENMYAQCNVDGEQYLLLKSICDHKKDGHAVEKADAYIIVNNRKSLRKTTKGWSLCVEWKDGTTTWEKLANLKESNPVEVAEYALSMGIEDEPAFKWWVPFTLNKRDRIILAVNSRYHKRTHKFGFEVPKTVHDAFQLDDQNKNDLWAKAIKKEMGKVRIAFDIKPHGEKAPVGYTHIGCHIIFDVKMENFQRKARMVGNGNETGTPASLTYASVVSRESVRIALTIAALNGLEVKTSDIENAYLTAPTTEKLFTVLGEEFGEDKGKVGVIVRALYGTKSAGAAFRNHLADCMLNMGYDSCKADPDVWLKECVRPDGTRYYGYILLYVDDALCINHDATAELDKLDNFFVMKPDSIGDPDIYLGGKIMKCDINEESDDSAYIPAWGISPTKYVKEAVTNVDNYLAKNMNGRKQPKKNATSPFSNGYRPELDISPVLDPVLCSYYQSQIGILRWMVELGRIDIITEVSELASQLAMPREGHLEAVFRVFSYLKYKKNSVMIFDPSYPEIDHDNFPKRDWNNFYGEVKEEIPPLMPKPLGREVILRLFCDSDFAGDGNSRRSRTGFFVFLNEAPIQWFSKKQTRVENSVFGAEFIAMKTGLDVTKGIRYKLRMMGIPITEPTYIYGDNMSVIYNTSKPESMLRKKANSICYHYIRENVAADECRTGHISTHENCADIATKPLSAGRKRDHLVSKVIYFFTTDE